jgi:hypothetical protein
MNKNQSTSITRLFELQKRSKWGHIYFVIRTKKCYNRQVINFSWGLVNLQGNGYFLNPRALLLINELSYSNSHASIGMDALPGNRITLWAVKHQGNHQNR